MSKNFIEVCLYEVKTNKTDEFETLIKEVGEFYSSQNGVINVSYMKRTHRQLDFNAVKGGELPVRLKRICESTTYALYWELENEEIHANITKLGLEKFYKKFARCLVTIPKIVLGEKINNN